MSMEFDIDGVTSPVSRKELKTLVSGGTGTAPKTLKKEFGKSTQT